MRKLKIGDNQTYYAKRIIKDGCNIKLIGATENVDGETRNLGNLLFPNMSNLEDVVLDDGKDFDVEVTGQQRIDDLELFYLTDRGLI